MQRDPAFANAKQNYMYFQRELDDRVKRLEIRHGTLADLDTAFEVLQLKRRTCPDCGLACKTLHHMLYVHNDSENCKARKAANEGKEYVTPGKERVVCECGSELFKENLANHLQRSVHKANMKLKEGAYFCHLCKKDFSKNLRPKRDYDAHCKGKKHLNKVRT